jgi:replicative DNA helicase
MLLDELQESIFEVSQDRQSVSYRSVREIVPDAMKMIEKMSKSKNLYTGVPSGFAELDSMTNGFQDSELIIIGARPSVGKTAFALNMAAHMALREKVPVCFFSLEMSDLSLTYRLLASEARINSEKVRSGLIKPSDIQSLMDAASRIYEAPLVYS